MKSRRAITTACHLFALASSTLLVKCSSTTCYGSVIALFFPDYLSMTPRWATRKQRTNKLGRCYQPERPFCTLATRYSLPSRTALFTYTCLSSQVSGRETRVHAGRWHAGHSHRLCPASRLCPAFQRRKDALKQRNVTKYVRLNK